MIIMHLNKLCWYVCNMCIMHTTCVYVYYTCCITSLYLSQLLLTQDMVSVSAQIARGMYHLSKKGGIVHKDLAARNI